MRTAPVLLVAAASLLTACAGPASQGVVDERTQRHKAQIEQLVAPPTDAGGRAVSYTDRSWIALRKLDAAALSVHVAKAMGAQLPAGNRPDLLVWGTVAPNLGWKNYPLRNRIQKTIGIPVVLDNDANCATLGEWWQGAARGGNTVVGMTIGTGVGGGVIIDAPSGRKLLVSAAEKGTFWCKLRVHGTPGLWVGDASLFPSSCKVNPQITIMALATRLAFQLSQAPVPA